MRKLSAILSAALLLGSLPGVAQAAPCRDAKGKCPPAAAKTQRCKNAKGKFAKCGTPGAKPI